MLHLPPHSTGTRSVVLALLFLCAAILAHAQESSSEVRHVKAVRFWTLGDVTRIAIETDGDFRVHSDRLENPDRLFFDLIGTTPALGGKGIKVIAVADRLVQRIRVAETARNVTRVVLDMEGVAEATTSRLENPDRLIIELRSPATAATAKTSVKPPVEVEPMTPAPAVNPSVNQQVNLPVKPPVEVAMVRPPAETLPPITVERRPFVPPPSRPASESTLRRVQPISSLDPPPFVATQSGMSPSAAGIGSKLAPLNYRASPPPAPPPVVVAKVSAPAMNLNIPPVRESIVREPTAREPAPTPVPKPALPAKRNSSGERSMIRVLGLKVGKIVLDAGHGGHDTGTIGPEGLREKDLVLDVTQRLGALIEERLGSEVIYTRFDDTFIPLERRTEIANQAKADLFLSIHANSSSVSTVAGVETYYLNFATSRTALELAAKENSGSEKTIFELQDLLQKIALKDKVEESREFATRIQSSLYAFAAKNDGHTRDRGVRKAPFAVLIGASMPSVLAEIGFISNAHDESVMNKAEYRQKLAEALFKGLSNYASTLSHFQVAQRH
jgi:N-acetylmuramoyl-L-alanine amidase